MSIAHYIKVIGRGKDSARPLTVDQAQDLMAQVLDGQASDLEIGAFCMAMRIKGETVAELDGFVRATQARTLTLAGCERGVVLLPSYNGARKLPNLTALLALQLARQGVAVLVHGLQGEPSRVTTAQIFEALGLPQSHSPDQVHSAWQAGQPAYMDLADLCPPLARLLRVRETIGVRNPGHTVAKLLDPIAPVAGRRTLRVVNHTHPDYALSLAAYLESRGADAVLMRGTEGEPFADVRRAARLSVFIGGRPQTALSDSSADSAATVPPDGCDASSASATARHIEAILCGRAALPPSIAAQIDALLQALAFDPPAA